MNRIVEVDDVLILLIRRIGGIENWLKEINSNCQVEQKHTEKGTVEREYWHYGYMVALKDIGNLLDKQAKRL